MGKIITTTDGKQIKRVSRWIKIKQAYNVTEKHSLYYYAEKIEENENILDYFVFNGRKYAISQFMRFGYPVTANYIQWYEKDKLYFMAGFDSENYYNPILIEVDEYGEYVRVYEEV